MSSGAKVRMVTKISPLGERVVHLTPDGRLQFWNTVTGRLEHEWVAPQHLVFKPRAVEWLSDEVVAYGSTSGEVCFLEFARNTTVGASLRSCGSTVLSLAFSDAHSLLFVGHENGRLVRWAVRKKWSGDVDK